MASHRPVALVTGAASGIGKAAALELVDAGYEVVGTSRHVEGSAPYGKVTFVPLDVSKDDSVAAAVEQMLTRFGRIDVLVNNAGVGSAGAAEETSLAQDHAAFEINVFGTIRMIKAVLPHMRAQGGGRIVNLSSVVGFIPMPFMAIYSASKHANEGYSWSLDHEVREYGIRVVTVEPAWTKTGFDVNSLQIAAPLHTYDARRKVAENLITDAVENGEDNAVVAKVIVAAATDKKPKLRYTAGSQARLAATMKRILPAGAFDQQMRKLNKIS
ncbi:SDR family NAD(P)-dependent oxidoreductase [Mycobacterium cookii]|nr:oxidoreductase [Mycobacterium cookii]MCV7330600.1 SDR family NAD(P)-dependent oxidoreductase [Mycobacterium cookii]